LSDLTKTNYTGKMAAKDHGPVYAEQDNPYNYIVIIDAGSTGSRAYVYHYPSRPLKDSEGGAVNFPQVSMSGHKWTKKINPGMSTFAEDPSKVGSDHMKELIKFAEKIVPESQHYRTPVYLHATGGLRLLSSKQQHDLLTTSCEYFQKKSDFYVPDCESHFSTIEGSTEGIFGWVAMNYLIGDFTNPESHEHGKGHTTYGFLDMGGASAQIAFVPNATGIESHKQVLYTVKLASIDGSNDMSFGVYSHSFLGAGIYEARRKYLEELQEGEDGKLNDPCLLKGQEEDIKAKRDIDDDDDDEEDDDEGDDEKDEEDEEDEDDEEEEEDDDDDEGDNNKEVNGDSNNKSKTGTPSASGAQIMSASSIVGTGDAEECLAKIEPQLSAIEEERIPAFDFEINHFIGVSEYFDTNHAFKLGSAYDRAKLAASVKEFCGSEWNDAESSYSDIKKSDLETLCFKSNWILGVIHSGFGFPEDFSLNETQPLTDYLAPLQTAQKFSDVEYSWTLGRAVLYASSAQGEDGKLMGIQPAFSNTWNYGGETGRRSRPEFDASRVTEDENDGQDWGDVLDSKSHRLWGSILFLLILFISVYLLMGRTRRRYIWESVKTRVYSFGNQRSEYLRVAQRRQENDRVAATQEFELNEVEDEFDVESDDEREITV
jgi:golgi apyrase